MKFRRHKQSTRRIKGSRRQRQHSPPPVGNKKLQTISEDGVKVSKPKKKQPRRKEDIGGNTPRAFAELMSRMNKEKDDKVPREADNDDKTGNRKTGDFRKESKKRADVVSTADKKATSEVTKSEELKILPGESFAEFTRRVNEALPIVRAKSGAPSMEAVRKMKKRQIAEANGQKPLLTKKQKRTAAAEEDDADDDGEDYSDEEAEERRYMELKTKRSNSPDPWKKLSRPPPPKFGEIAAAPPVLNLPSKKLVNVPKKAGPLSERLVLEAEREQVIGKYRAMVGRKRKLHPESAQ
ncbi:hypothetical protein V1525DRAFT_400535 [Lipomyces kononenkoae]|uniref:Uncharacterized protein n=1 Tax=Lipomyces kononenkoae TaxID=34357 RepID=A0ACC3T3T8_LIPKO